MNGDILSAEINGGLQAVFKGIQIILRQPCDEIHIDIIKAAFPCKRKGIKRLLHGVPPADCLQHGIIEALRINAYSAHAC